ncbi:hypothetical protein EXN66_Car015195 [Channa argus]|uniref:Uncharacterized protein n=1 Tax=Channa argus TaxID=215402 RepID=A0A6G1QB59_CHAAH|nr:hypothetical protein EXN66_Car015195 [Channa argus]
MLAEVKGTQCDLLSVTSPTVHNSCSPSLTNMSLPFNKHMLNYTLLNFKQRKVLSLSNVVFCPMVHLLEYQFTYMLFQNYVCGLSLR